MGDRLSLFEKAVLQKILFGDLSELTNLRSQIEMFQEVRRELTGVGFYLDFTVSANVPKMAGYNVQLGNDVVAEIDGLNHGAGFVLFYRRWYSYDASKDLAMVSLGRQ